MSILSRRRPWREPPILFQILALLLGGLVVAQLVTLLLTLVLPPAPPSQHSVNDVIAALRGQTGGKPLTRLIQAAPPDVGGPGWFTSEPSRHDLAIRLGAKDGDVRLAFYAPLPFAGITSAPMRPSAAVREIAWQAASDPLRPTPAGLLRASLLLVDQPSMPHGGQAGGFPGGLPGGGFPGRDGSAYPDGALPGTRAPEIGAGRSGVSPGRGMGADRGSGADAILREDKVQHGATPSPSDLDRQPIAPPLEDRGAGTDRGYRTRVIEGARPDFYDLAPSIGTTVGTAPVPREAPPIDISGPSLMEAPPSAPPSVPAHSSSHMPATSALLPPPAAPTPMAEKASAAPAPTVPIEARPIPIRKSARALFGLAPAPFMEGDFVAALRQPDGRWIVVQPAAAPFPNAWQRRVMLWFAIAFAIVAPIGWLFARHIVRPLAHFTAAAERLGRDPSTALVALEGPAEISRAAHALNVMQSRLQSFVDDRTAMVGAISHDLRTPLTRLRFRIEEVDDEIIREEMSGEVAEMEAMISSVLSFIRNASTPNARERLDLGLLVEDVAQDAALVGSDVQIESVAAAPVEVDVLGMRRLLANLVENAVKYGDRARIRLAVEEGAAIAEICDDGPGVPEDELERAFEPFYRASNAIDSGKRGSGLGLAVCRSIARAHGGDVRLVRSATGFSAQLRLPLAYDATSMAA